jgi:cysteinyl-tRNA synthetase
MTQTAATLKLYDTATREISEFKPLTPGQVSMYVCGATVQGAPHIGHVRSGINFDILRRWLIKNGYEVTFIRNVTDIDDKILHKAIHEEMPWWALALKYERIFSEAYAALNVLRPTYEPRATGHITQMIELMQKLIENGAAYAPGNGDVYLEVRKLKRYLILSRQHIDDLQPAQDAEQTHKKDVRDFALWKAAKPGEPSWPTPWGPGRPGWHLECSAMAHAYLGETFDIHGGGLDLVFPHHENEIAQSEAAGYGFAQRWLHNAWVTQSGEKMSKSLGNTLQVHEILKEFRGIELRWYLGSAHYRSMLEYSPEALREAATNFRRIENFLTRATEIVGAKPTPRINPEFSAAMNDDLAVPAALATISENLRLGNQAITDNDTAAVSKNADEIRGALEILGCDPLDVAFASSGGSDVTHIMDGVIKLALAERASARDRKDFAASDAIRDGLAALGITIEDTAQGPRWSIS